MSADASDVYRKLMACARFEIASTGDMEEFAPSTLSRAQRQARVLEARLRNAEEMAQAVQDFDILMRAGQPLPPEWRRREM
jgi:hypothetical protein